MDSVTLHENIFLHFLIILLYLFSLHIQKFYWIPKYLSTGPPGSGKKEAAAKVAAQKGYVHLSVGQMLREEASKDTDEARELAAAIAAGTLPRWDIMMLLSLAIDAQQDVKGFVIDGFPRTKEQAEGFTEKVSSLREFRRKWCLIFRISLNCTCNMYCQVNWFKKGQWQVVLRLHFIFVACCLVCLWRLSFIQVDNQKGRFWNYSTRFTC